jgi:hypothetical protein
MMKKDAIPKDRPMVRAETEQRIGRAVLDALADLAISEVKKKGVFVLPGLGKLIRVEK